MSLNNVSSVRNKLMVLCFDSDGLSVVNVVASILAEGVFNIYSVFVS